MVQHRHSMMKTASTLLLALLLGLAGQQVQACGYDAEVNNPFQLAYPGSLVLALETRAALKTHQLQQLAELKGEAGLARSQRWLEDLRGRLAAQGFSGSLSLLLVDSGLRSRFSDNHSHKQSNNHDGSGAVTLPNSGQPLALEMHSEEPEEGEGMIVTTEVALAALLAGEIGLDQAQQMGVLRVHKQVNLGLLNAALGRASVL
jgi:hypothetical protein